MAERNIKSVSKICLKCKDDDGRDLEIIYDVAGSIPLVTLENGKLTINAYVNLMTIVSNDNSYDEGIIRREQEFLE